MKIGYVRVSTGDQNPDLQISSLKQAGCKRIFTDTGKSGGLHSRRELDKCLASLKVGNELGQRGVGFRSLPESIDTETAGGRLVFHMMGRWPSSSGH